MKTLLTLCCLFMAIVCYGQKKKTITKPLVANPNKFMGIGILKIGSDTTVLIDYAQTHVDFIRNSNSVMRKFDYEYMNKNNGSINGLVRVKENKMSNNPDVDEYYLSKYEVAGINIYNIGLTYYKGKLIKYTSDVSVDLNEALRSKYGIPKVNTKTKTCKCLYNLSGIERPLEEVTIHSTWDNGPIWATVTAIKEYDEKCKEKNRAYIYYQVLTPELDKWESAHGFTDIDKYIKDEKKRLKDL